MLKGIGYLLFGIGLCFVFPKFINQYKKEKSFENLLEFVGCLLLIVSSILLGILEIF